MNIANLNYLLALGTVAMQITTVILLIAYLFPRSVPNADQLRVLVEKWGMHVILVLSVAGIFLTQLYDHLGFEPCALCWWQRIFLYPLAVMFGMSFWKEKYRDSAIDFGLVLSVLGAGTALYHHVLQMMPAGTLPCPAVGVSCAKITFLEFGYVTYPMMAFALFGLSIVTLLFLRRTHKMN